MCVYKCPCVYLCTCVMEVHVCICICIYMYMLANISQNNQPFILEGKIFVDSSVCATDTVSDFVTEGTTLCSWITDSSTLLWKATMSMNVTKRSKLFQVRATGQQT
jgi:hypothetical protein